LNFSLLIILVKFFLMNINSNLLLLFMLLEKFKQRMQFLGITQKLEH
jgi:hypothetical protein